MPRNTAMGNRWLCRLIIVVLGVGVVTTPAAVAEAAMTLRGDKTAWKEIDAALTRLHALPGWRVRESQPGDRVAGELEFAPPNYHFIRRTPIGAMEFFQVGDVTVSRSSTKKHPEAKCRRFPRTGALPPQDLKDFMASRTTGELTIGRKPDTSIGGVPVHAYTYLLKRGPVTTPGGPAIVRGDIFITARTGFPLRSTSETPGGSMVTRDYYDYGAKIAFTLPC